jgi:hypothetical protein
MAKKIKKCTFHYYKEDGIIVCCFTDPQSGEEKKIRALEDVALIQDALTFIRNSPDMYDVVVNIVTAPWQPGAFERYIKERQAMGITNITLVNEETGERFRVPELL